MNLQMISTQLLYTTVPLVVEKTDGTTAGTAFVYTIPIAGTDKSVPLLVTCWHVVQNARRGVMQFTRGKDGSPQKGEALRIEFNGEYFSSIGKAQDDIAAAPLAGVINQIQSSGAEAFYRTISPDIVPTDAATQELAAIEDVTIIGYPSGVFDVKNASPIVRRGITATPIWNDFNGEPKFLIDAGIFPGSSGSPVFILNEGAYPTKDGLTIGSRILFVGMITQTFFGEESKGNRVYLNLGQVINSRRLTEFFASIERQLPKPND